MSLAAGQYLDRRLRGSELASVYSGGSTTWTLPYTVAAFGSEGTLVVANPGTGEVYPSTRPAANQITVAGQDLTDTEVFIGILYTAYYALSTIYERDDQGRPKLNGRLTVRSLKLYQHDTTSLTATVRQGGRSDAATVYSSPTAAQDTVRVPVMGKNTDVDIAISDATPGSLTLSAIEWEGTQAPRSRR